ncbi:MAG: hypothetical protein ABI743_13680, partial [bacterium]
MDRESPVGDLVVGLLTGLCYAAILAVCFLPQLLGQQTLFAGDIHQHYLPWEHFVSRTLHVRELPIWDPAFYCGHPLLAEGQAAVWYPLSRAWYAWLGTGVLATDIQAF